MQDRFFHIVMAVMAVLIILASVIGAHLTGVSVLFSSLLYPRGVALLALVLAALFYWWRREPYLLNVVMIAFWGILFTGLYILPMYVAARLRPELHDPLLARIDAGMGLEVPAILDFMKAYPTAQDLLNRCYNLLHLIFVTAIVAPPIFGKMQRAKEFAIACLLAVLICMPLFGVFQAIGPWVHYESCKANDDQQKYVLILTALRDGPNIYVLDYNQQEGLITFPSFHGILAMLAAFALWPIRYLRWPAVILALLIVISTLTTGWHYVIDVVAGILISIVVCAAAKGYTLFEARIQGQTSEVSKTSEI